MDAKSKQGEGDSIALQVTLFAFLLLLAMLVILTCIWKIVKLIAAFKMESRIEELEQMTANEQEVVLSPREFRNLRRLSVLAGFSSRSGGSLCCSDKGGSGTVNSVRERLASLLVPSSSNARTERGDNKERGAHKDVSIPKRLLAAKAEKGFDLAEKEGSQQQGQTKISLPNGKAVAIGGGGGGGDSRKVDRASSSGVAGGRGGAGAGILLQSHHRIAPASPLLSSSPVPSPPPVERRNNPSGVKISCAIHGKQSPAVDPPRRLLRSPLLLGQPQQRHCRHNPRPPPPPPPETDDERHYDDSHSHSQSSSWTPEPESSTPPPPPPSFRLGSAPPSRRRCNNSCRYHPSEERTEYDYSPFRRSPPQHPKQQPPHSHGPPPPPPSTNLPHVHTCPCGASFPNLPLLSFPLASHPIHSYLPRSSYGSHPNIMEQQTLLLRSPSPYFIPSHCYQQHLHLGAHERSSASFTQVQQQQQQHQHQHQRQPHHQHYQQRNEDPSSSSNSEGDNDDDDDTVVERSSLSRSATKLTGAQVKVEHRAPTVSLVRVDAIDDDNDDDNAATPASSSSPFLAASRAKPALPPLFTFAPAMPATSSSNPNSSSPDSKARFPFKQAPLPRLPRSSERTFEGTEGESRQNDRDVQEK